VARVPKTARCRQRERGLARRRLLWRVRLYLSGTQTAVWRVWLNECLAVPAVAGRIYANATTALRALSAYDPCWYNTSELQRCNGEGHHVPRHLTNLTTTQWEWLMHNASYADAATPHL
jgi:hypothetical protein